MPETLVEQQKEQLSKQGMYQFLESIDTKELEQSLMTINHLQTNEAIEERNLSNDGEAEELEEYPGADISEKMEEIIHHANSDKLQDLSSDIKEILRQRTTKSELIDVFQATKE